MTLSPRRHRPVLLSAASAMCLLATGPALAETLQEAMVEAYTSNPQLLAERARLRATDEELAQANAGWRPKVSITGSAGKGRDYGNDINTDSWSAEITATQPIFSGGRVLASGTVAGVKGTSASVTGRWI